MGKQSKLEKFTATQDFLQLLSSSLTYGFRSCVFSVFFYPISGEMGSKVKAPSLAVFEGMNAAPISVSLALSSHSCVSTMNAIVWGW